MKAPTSNGFGTSCSNASASPESLSPPRAPPRSTSPFRWVSGLDELELRAFGPASRVHRAMECATDPERTPAAAPLPWPISSTTTNGRYSTLMVTLLREFAGIQVIPVHRTISLQAGSDSDAQEAAAHRVAVQRLPGRKQRVDPDLGLASAAPATRHNRSFRITTRGVGPAPAHQVRHRDAFALAQLLYRINCILF